jgi:hypothetical protein
MEFHEKHPELRDKYEIVTFHGHGAKSIEELRPHLTQLEENVWKRKFPFPILLDNTEETVKNWGIFAYPTVVLIDPQGRVAATRGAFQRLQKELGVASDSDR